MNAITVLPIGRSPDPIQLHAEAHNALSMALHYLHQPESDLSGATRKAAQALTALGRLYEVRGAYTANTSSGRA